MNSEEIQMASRGSRKYAFSEIDSSRFFHYRVGEQVNIPLVVELKSGEYLIEQNIDWSGFVHPQLFDFFIIIGFDFVSQRAHDTRMIVRLDDNPDTDAGLVVRVRRGLNKFSGRLPLNLGSESVYPRKVCVFLESYEPVEVSSPSFVLSRFSSRRVIKSDLFFTGAFYVTSIRLYPGDSVALDSRLNVVSNSSSVVRDFDYLSKPLATDFLWLDGSCEVSFFVVEEEDL